MTTLRSLLILTFACLLCGCTLQREGASSGRYIQTASKGQQSEDAQTAFRRELLKNQLRQSQTDLQSATSEEERRSIQERIDIIRNQMDRLDR